MEKFTEIFKKFKTVDIIIVAGVILALIVGFLTYKNFRQTASKQIEATSKITFQVFVRGVTLTGNENPMRANDKTFISIRNVPYSDLDVIGVKFEPKKIVLPVKGPKGYVVAVDEGQFDTYDIIVRVKDKAQITKDGAVVGGNKIKMGMPITLEGKTYKFTGSVSDMSILNEED